MKVPIQMYRQEALDHYRVRSDEKPVVQPRRPSLLIPAGVICAALAALVALGRTSVPLALSGTAVVGPGATAEELAVEVRVRGGGWTPARGDTGLIFVPGHARPTFLVVQRVDRGAAGADCGGLSPERCGRERDREVLVRGTVARGAAPRLAAGAGGVYRAEIPLPRRPLFRTLVP